MINYLINRQLKKLQNVRISEIFEDGDMEAFEAFIKADPNNELLILNNRDHDLRTPLHMVCKKGYKDFFLKLLPLYIKHKLDLDSFDENGDTPLVLACSHCYEENFNFNATLEEDPEQNAKIELILRNRFENQKNNQNCMMESSE